MFNLLKRSLQLYLNYFYINMCSKLKVLKYISAALCAFGFFIMSWQLMKDFLHGATIVSSNFVKQDLDETLMSPSILICNHTAFKSLRISTNLEEYLNDTIDPEDIFIDTGFMDQIIVGKFRSIYTPYKGRCFVFQPSIKVCQ